MGLKEQIDVGQHHWYALSSTSVGTCGLLAVLEIERAGLVYGNSERTISGASLIAPLLEVLSRAWVADVKMGPRHGGQINVE